MLECDMTSVLVPLVLCLATTISLTSDCGVPGVPTNGKITNRFAMIHCHHLAKIKGS